MKKTIYVQFTAGKGPTECAVACMRVFEKFLSEFSEMFPCQVIECEEDYDEGFRSIVLEMREMTDDYISEIKKKWEGTVKYIATKNHIRPNHKRKNWFVGVNFFEAPETIYDGNLNPKDLKWETMRSGGPGGQHVNKVESAARVTHIPTGITVRCDVYRDQQKNREMSVKLLIAKLNALNSAKKEEQKNLIWMNHNALERGNEIMTIKGEI